jgi:hypothetical protein
MNGRAHGRTLALEIDVDLRTRLLSCAWWQSSWTAATNLIAPRRAILTIAPQIDVSMPQFRASATDSRTGHPHMAMPAHDVPTRNPTPPT